MKLANDNKEHRLVVRLNKDFQRDFSLRLFLDSNAEYGINRKEAVLQMYETLLANGFIGEDMRLRQIPIGNRDAIKEISEMTEKRFHDNIRLESQSDVEDIDPNDFDGL